MPKLYFMRHGQTLFNLLRRKQGWCDSPLTELGIEQAKTVGATLRGRGLTFDHAYSSTSERACDTLELAFPGQPYERVKGLKEWNFGKFEGASEDLNPRLPYGDFKIAVRQARIQILARALKLAKVPLLKALDALVRLTGKRKFKRVARTLGRRTVRMVKRKATPSQGRTDSFSLLDPQLGKRRVAPTLLAAKQVKERLTVTHKVQFWHETSVIAIVCQRLLHLEVGLSQSLFGKNHHKGA